MEYFFREVSAALRHAVECLLNCEKVAFWLDDSCVFENVEDAQILQQVAKKTQKYGTRV